MRQSTVDATLFRGGTSKGVYFDEHVLPEDTSEWDELLLNMYGSPDPMQIDGIGGTHSSTSKAMIVSKSDRDGVDVNYRFGQVGVEKPVVDWGGNCGNLTFAIGPFAIEKGIVEPEPTESGSRELVLWNSNTDTTVRQSVPVTEEGKPRYAGDFRVYGVPKTGAKIRSHFLDPSGAMTDELFPTGNRVDTLDVPSIGTIDVSLVDVTNPLVFVQAEDLDLRGDELPAELLEQPDVLETLENIRSIACERLGFVDDRSEATDRSPGVPKIAFVAEPGSYETSNGERIDRDEIDLTARIMSMQKPHHAYAVTGAMCTAAATRLSDTIPNRYVSDPTQDEIVIGHPKGPLAVGVGLDGDHVEYTRVDRTARMIMDGELYHSPK